MSFTELLSRLSPIYSRLSPICSRLSPFCSRLSAIRFNRDQTIPNSQSESLPRPPGPSLLDLFEIFNKDDVFVNLEYPLRLMQKYGPLCKLPFARNTYLVSGPREMEEILKTKAHQFNKANFLYRRLRILFGKSLLVTDGAYWKHRRKISQPAFQMNKIKEYAPHMTDACLRMIDTLLKKPKNKIDMVSLMNLTSLNLTFKLFCGEEISSKALKQLGKSVYYSNWYLTHTMFIRPWKLTYNNFRFFFTIHHLNYILLKMIRNRRAKLKNLAQEKIEENKADKPRHEKTIPNDLMQMLIDANNEDDTAPLTDREILNEYKTLILTGHETTAAGLSWMWYLLAKYPYYRDLLEEELARVLGGRTPTMEDLPNLNMLRAIICETYRLYPPIWSVFRTNTEANEISGYSLPANSTFILNFFVLHRNPEYWENPSEFNPHRFLGDALKKQDNFSFLPFSSGPRICIANHFAMIETMLMAATLAQKVRFELLPNSQIYPEPCVSLRPKGNLWMKAVPR
jgi:cytochrome P450